MLSVSDLVDFHVTNMVDASEVITICGLEPGVGRTIAGWANHHHRLDVLGQQ